MSEVKLHLGCGEKCIPGFVHIDLADYPHVDHQADISSLPMFADSTVDLIYCCHALEYFDRQEVKRVLAEWFRVLKNGGILRIAVPDFEGIVAVYKKYGDLEHSGILGPLYGRWQNENNNDALYHKTTYDFYSLSKTLKRSGFKNVQRYEVDETIHKDYDDYSQAYVPHMDKENGILISLNVEATK